MEIDDPAVPEFASWDSFERFCRSVRHERRYIWSAAETAFLETVRATVRERDVELPKGAILYRAQAGIDWHMRTDDEGNELGEEPSGYGRKRMKPRVNQAAEGRANPAGIPVLYLGTTAKTAISEVRPWIGASISLAQFRIRRPLRAIDLSRGHGKSSFSEIGFKHIFDKASIDAATKERAVWIDIDNGFSRPVTLTDDLGDYVPTQILAELFRDIGYDAVVYKSQFGEKGYNVAMFNPDDADPINCAPYEVTTIEVEFKEAGNPWSTVEEPTEGGAE